MVKGIQCKMKITSVNNDIIKNISKLQQRKYRDENGLFLLEGEKAVEEALDYGINIRYLFVEEDSELFMHSDRIETTQAVLSKISTTVTPPKVVGVGEQVERIWSNDYKRVVLLEDIKDAGNLGTIIRTACAFNVDAIILYGDTVDLYNPKCVRASVGNLWKVPIFSLKNLEELQKYTGNLIPISTLPKNKDSIYLKEFKVPEAFVMMFGTESCGLSNELIEYTKKRGQFLTVEMTDKVESLNLSISTGIILYKLFIEN